ncbi:MAG: hypothetical protein IKZ88_10440 [Neisseriaceae bacterium]|nr:hypothetical protein [Neisseriaceae bacterium]
MFSGSLKVDLSFFYGGFYGLFGGLQKFACLFALFVGWVFNPPFAPIGAILFVSGCLKLFVSSTPIGVAVG